MAQKHGTLKFPNSTDFADFYQSLGIRADLAHYPADDTWGTLAVFPTMGCHFFHIHRPGNTSHTTVRVDRAPGIKHRVRIADGCSKASDRPAIRRGLGILGVRLSAGAFTFPQERFLATDPGC